LYSLPTASLSESAAIQRIPQICAVAQNAQTIRSAMFRPLILALLLLLAVGCRPAKSPQLRVIGLQEARAREVVYVQVTNPASRPMRLTKLEYRFASSGGSTLSEGELTLHSREVPAGSAIVVEVPLESAPEEAMTLRGKLTAEQDHITKSFKVSAEIRP